MQTGGYKQYAAADHCTAERSSSITEECAIQIQLWRHSSKLKVDITHFCQQH